MPLSVETGWLSYLFINDAIKCSSTISIVFPKNKGNIDFKKLGVQLNCLDCNEDKYYTDTQFINSTDVIQQNGRVYISTLIIMPDDAE